MNIKTGIMDLQLKERWQISRGGLDTKQCVLVTLEKDGITGYGEASPNTRYGESVELTLDRIHSVADIYRTHHPFHYREIKAELDEAITDQSCAKAALDMALLDWFGKKWDLPVYRIWGLNPVAAPLSTFTIGIASPEEIRRKVREAADFPLLKIKVGVDNDDEIIGAVRAETDKPLRVDANEGWTDRQLALEKIQWLATQNVEFVEQPMPAGSYDDVAWLREHSPLPLVADEDVKTAKDIPRLKGVYDGINIKLMKSGGLLEGLQMVHVARAMGLKIMLGCMIESALAISAAAQLAPLVDWADLDSNLLLSHDPFNGIRANEGKLRLTNQPGLGSNPR